MEISQLSLKRLFNRAGIRRVSNSSYRELYGLVEKFTQNIIEKSATLIKSRNNAILSQNEIKNGYLLNNILDIVNQTVQEGGLEAGWCDNNPSQCGQIGGVAYCDGQLSQCGNFSEQALLECQGTTQTGGDYFFTIPATQYQRFTNEILNKQEDEVKITKSGLRELQFLVEKQAVEYLAKLNQNNQQKVFQL